MVLIEYRLIGSINLHCGCVSFQFQVPGGSGTLEPHLCVTVLAYCGSAANKVDHCTKPGGDLVMKLVGGLLTGLFNACTHTTFITKAHTRIVTRGGLAL